MHRFRLGAIGILVAAALGADAGAQPVEPTSPDPTGQRRPALPAVRIEPVDGEPDPALADLYARTLDSVVGDEPVEEIDAERQARRVRAALEGVLATEGYFSPTIGWAADPRGEARFVVRVATGARTTVGAVELLIRGPIESDPVRLAQLQDGWELPVGRPFRSAEWSRAKVRLLSRVQERSWLGARLVDASAQVDPQAARALLRVEIDSGPPFTVGPLLVEGLQRHDADLVARYNPFAPGDPYDATRLLEFQRRLQQSPYFSSVLVDVEPDPSTAQDAPIRVRLSETPARRATFGVGYSTNTGPRGEATYRQIGLFGAPLTLQTGLGIDKTRSVAFADVLLPAKAVGDDSFGTLFERTDINQVLTRRWAIGAARRIERERSPASTETRYAINLQREYKRILDPAADPPSRNDVLTVGVNWTRRDIDSITHPTDGDLITLAATGGVRRSALTRIFDAVFLRSYGRYVRYRPLSARNHSILRAEAGYVATQEPDFVPQDQLFRTGGIGTVRGFPYLSLGEREGNAVVGSGALFTASAEIVRWFTPEWGGAAFVDLGDAARDFSHFSLAQGYGLGARWRTVAGPLALDLAYGRRTPEGLGGRLRLHFSVAIAF